MLFPSRFFNYRNIDFLCIPKKITELIGMKKISSIALVLLLSAILFGSCEKKNYRCYCYLPGDTTGYSQKFFYFDNTSKFWAEKQCDIIARRVQKVFPDYSCLASSYYNKGIK